jgi:hypothetical protein
MKTPCVEGGRLSESVAGPGQLDTPVTRGCFPTIDQIDVEDSLPHRHGELVMMAPQTQLIVGTPWRRIVGFDGIATDSRVFMGKR